MTKKKTLNTAIAVGLSGLVLLAGSVQAHAAALSLQGKTIGVAVVGTQHFWDREAFKGASSEVEKLGGKVVAVDGGRNNQVHADNHDILLARKVDAVILLKPILADIDYFMPALEEAVFISGLDNPLSLAWIIRYLWPR
ncbi:TPA: ABC transporter substrate-binding protein [Yersinia enterocolitica]|nr:ABC transporter substrate-binding protein [Yersinia enterocolitica]HDL8722469.1 ABC transporter substrate-binding protein [Yersinia enterocolitica]